MEFGFREPQRPFRSGSQLAKAWTEGWVAEHMFCPNCGCPTLSQLPANSPVADFFCPQCADQFELKSQRKQFGRKLANGAYSAKQERLRSATNPNLLLLSYDLKQRTVRNLFVVPKHFFVLEIVEKRKPLAITAQRAGWIGSNILLDRIPDSGRIRVVNDGKAVPREAVLSAWQQTLFLRERHGPQRGWLLEVMRCIEAIGTQEFTLDDIYAYENALSGIYPGNNNVRPKIRQQLQVLRDSGYLEFYSKGKYRRNLL
jgi:hypothetical protein